MTKQQRADLNVAITKIQQLVGRKLPNDCVITISFANSDTDCALYRDGLRISHAPLPSAWDFERLVEQAWLLHREAAK